MAPHETPLRLTGEETPAELAGLAEQLLQAIGRLRRDIRRAADPAAWPLAPLTGGQMELLKLLRRRPGLPVAEAAEELGLAANSVSTLVGQLVAAGMVERTRSAADRRVAELRLTESARSAIEGWRDRRAGAVAAGLAGFTERELAQLEEALPLLPRLGQLIAAAGAAGTAEHEAEQEKVRR